MAHAADRVHHPVVDLIAIQAIKLFLCGDVMPEAGIDRWHPWQVSWRSAKRR